MQRKTLEMLSKRLEKQIKRATYVTEQSKRSAIDVSRGAAASPSKSGDREHAVNQARINAENLEGLKALQKEVLEAVGKTVPETAKTTCKVGLEIGGEKLSVYLVDNPVYLEGLSLISCNSPLGKAISDKKAGESFNYKLRNKTVSGVITKIG